MNEELYQQCKKVIANRPDGATHATDFNPAFNLYAKVEHLCTHQIYLVGRFVDYPIHGDLHSLSDMQMMVDMYEKLQGALNEA